MFGWRSTCYASCPSGSRSPKSCARIGGACRRRRSNRAPERRRKTMWHRQLLKRIEGYGPHRSEVEYLDPNFTAIIDDKQSLSPLLEQMLPRDRQQRHGAVHEDQAAGG